MVDHAPRFYKLVPAAPTRAGVFIVAALQEYMPGSDRIQATAIGQIGFRRDGHQMQRAHFLAHEVGAFGTRKSDLYVCKVLLEIHEGQLVLDVHLDIRKVPVEPGDGRRDEGDAQPGGRADGHAPGDCPLSRRRPEDSADSR